MEQDQLPCKSAGTSSGNFQETETCMVRSCHMTRQPLQNHPSRHLGGWSTPWLAEEMLDGQKTKSGHPCPCQNCSQGPPVEKTGRGSLLNRPSCPSDDPIGQGIELNGSTPWNKKNRAILHVLLKYRPCRRCVVFTSPAGECDVMMTTYHAVRHFY